MIQRIIMQRATDLARPQSDSDIGDQEQHQWKQRPNNQEGAFTKMPCIKSRAR
jgi:hypothetical protein